jgi:hypothetical protein
MVRHQVINKCIDIIRAAGQDSISYCEIGVDSPNNTFNHVRANYKVAVDPYNDDTRCHAWSEDNKHLLMQDIKGDFRRQTSDEYFNSIDLNTTSHSVIFIDGLHLEEQVDRDIRNSLLAVGGKKWLILVDDVCPNSWEEANEVPNYGGGWRGTVYRSFWKIRSNPRYLSGVIHEINCGFIMERPKNRPAPAWNHPTAINLAAMNNARAYGYYLDNRHALMNEIYCDTFFKSYFK